MGQVVIAPHYCRLTLLATSNGSGWVSPVLTEARTGSVGWRLEERVSVLLTFLASPVEMSSFITAGTVASFQGKC